MFLKQKTRRPVSASPTHSYIPTHHDGTPSPVYVVEMQRYIPDGVWLLRTLPLFLLMLRLLLVLQLRLLL